MVENVYTLKMMSQCFSAKQSIIRPSLMRECLMFKIFFFFFFCGISLEENNFEYLMIDKLRLKYWNAILFSYWSIISELHLRNLYELLGWRD